MIASPDKPSPREAFRILLPKLIYILKEPSMPAWLAPQSMKMGTTRNELDSPPREGCRGGLFQTGRTHP